jgi:hypothetical protein
MTRRGHGGGADAGSPGTSGPLLERLTERVDASSVGVERVAGIEPAQSAWKALAPHASLRWSEATLPYAVPSVCLSGPLRRVGTFPGQLAVRGGQERRLPPARQDVGEARAENHPHDLVIRTADAPSRGQPSRARQTAPRSPSRRRLAECAPAVTAGSAVSQAATAGPHWPPQPPGGPDLGQQLTGRTTGPHRGPAGGLRGRRAPSHR